MAKAPINVTISGDYNDRDIKRAIRDLESLRGQSGDTVKSFGGLSTATKAAGAAVAAGLSVAAYAVLNFTKDAIGAASDLAESQSKVSVVFGDQARIVQEWAKSSALAFGQTEQQALEAAGTYGNLFQAFGLTRNAAQEMSMTMVELAADLASFNNTSIDDAIEALRSGLSGETEPLKRFGIALNDNRMKAEALALGIYDGVGALTAAQKAQAAYAVILNDTKLAQGDFERTSDGLANTMRIVQAQVKNLQTEFGTGFLESLVSVTDQSGELKSILEDLRPTARNAGKDVGNLGLGALQAGSNFYSMYRAIASGNWDLVRRMVFATNDELIDLNKEALVGADSLNYYTAQGAAMEAQLRANSAALRATAAATRAATAANLALGSTQDAASVAADRYTGLAKSLGAEIGWGTLGLQKYNIYLEEVEKRTKKAGSSTKEAKDEFAGLRKQFGEPLADKALEFLDKLKDRASTLKDEFMSFYESIRSNVNSTLTFAGALEEMNNARDRFTQTQERVATATERVNSAIAAESEARARYNEVMADSDAKASERESVQNALNNAIKNTATATRDLTTAQQDDAKAADEAGKTYLQRLQEQAGAAQKFLETITTLYAMGLRGEALAQIGQMSATAGITAGEQLIAGGEAAILESMRLVDATNAAAAKVAELTTVGFKGTGAMTAENTVKGFEDVMGDEGTGRKKLMRIMDRLAADMRRETTITVTTIHRSVYESVGLPGRAMGGPVTADQAYVVGERGPEVFVPDVAGTIVPNHAVMSPARGGIGGGSINLTVNAGMGTDGAEVGRQIVDALRQYQRRNGPVPISVA